MTGKTISHYKILEKLGEGGMGIVYKAHDTKLDRTVALKFLPQNLAVDDTEKQRFLHEARSASALDHSNICSIYSIEETDDGSMFIVMAYYDGVSLQGKVGQSPLPIKEVLTYSIQIAAGLQKAHGKGIVHRDLKPANIFITPDDQIKIIDFGLAKAAHRTILTKSGTTLGTVPYMSPEQAQGNPADNRTDIWSLGVVMYEMITGQRPFKSEYETALVYAIMNEDPEPVTGLRSGVPISLEGIVRKCLEKDPQNRYQHVDDIIVDLRRVEKEISSGVQSKATISGQPTKIDAREDHTVTRRIHPLVYGIPVLLLALIGLFVYLPDRTTVAEMSRSIAVLPLENLSPDPDDAYFAAGMHEDIIIQLSRIGDIQVIARSSVLGYDAGQRNIQRISNDLGVQSILEGSVRRIVNRVRVAVTLTDVQTNRTLWADTFDRDLTDIFAIQSEIALEIANALEARLTDIEKRQLVDNPTAVTEAYEYYLRAREYFTRPGPQYDSYKNAEFLLKKAIEYDPQFAHAHALLSRTYTTLRWFGYDTSSETLELSLQNATRAFQLQPDLPEAYIAMGYYYYYGFRDYDIALEYFNNALLFQPNNAEVIAAIGFVERRLGSFEDSIRNLSKAISLDPRNINLLFNNAQSFVITGRHQEAKSLFERALSISPNFILLRIFLSLNDILWKGDIESTRTFLNDYSHFKNESPGDWLRMQFIISDFEGMIQTVHDVPLDMYRGQLFLYVPSFILGLAYDHMGDHELARQHYEKALSEYVELSSIHDNDLRYMISLGRTYAGLGLAEQANAEIKKAIALVSDLDDMLNSSAYKTDIATIYAKLQNSEETVKILRDVLSTPGFQSIERVKIDPAWDPIRNTSEFQDLLREFERNV